MSIPISIIFPISPPMTYFWPKLVHLFFHIGNRYEKIKFAFNIVNVRVIRLMKPIRNFSYLFSIWKKKVY